MTDMMHFWLYKSENIALHDEFDVQMRLYIGCTLVVHSRTSGFTSSHMHHLLELEFYITNLLEAIRWIRGTSKTHHYAPQEVQRWPDHNNTTYKSKRQYD